MTTTTDPGTRPRTNVTRVRAICLFVITIAATVASPLGWQGRRPLIVLQSRPCGFIGPFQACLGSGGQALRDLWADRGSDCGVEQHVAADAADFLVASQQTLALEARALGGVLGRSVPGFDVELDAVESRDGPGECDECCQGVSRDTTPAFCWCNGVSGGRPTCWEVFEPEADLPERPVVGRVRDGERKPRPSAHRLCWRLTHEAASAGVACAGRVPISGK